MHVVYICANVVVERGEGGVEGEKEKGERQVGWF